MAENVWTASDRSVYSSYESCKVMYIQRVPRYSHVNARLKSHRLNELIKLKDNSAIQKNREQNIPSENFHFRQKGIQ